MLRKLRAASGLSLSDWATIARAWRLLWIATVSLRRGVALPELRQRLSSGPRSDDLGSSRHLARMVRAAALLHPLPVACLARSLCLEALLRSHGADARLRVGVRREGRELLAHAWVEVEGVAVAEPVGVADRFLPLHSGGMSDG